MGWPSSMLGTSRMAVQICAGEWSMGREQTDSVPKRTPNCTAISTALKETARTAGRKRLRPCHRIFSEYGLRMVNQEELTTESQRTQRRQKKKFCVLGVLLCALCDSVVGLTGYYRRG